MLIGGSVRRAAVSPTAGSGPRAKTTNLALTHTGWCGATCRCRQRLAANPNASPTAVLETIHEGLPKPQKTATK
jgi:hypothetical protein